MKMSRQEEIVKLATQSGLDSAIASRHLKRFLRSRQSDYQSTIPILDTCRLDNGGILPPDWLSQTSGADLLASSSIPDGVVSFIPAAGASTRYYKKLYEIMSSFESGSSAANAKVDLNEIKQAISTPIPIAVRSVLEKLLSRLIVDSKDKEAAKLCLLEPKGLQPCNREGEHYFSIQCQLNKRLGEFLGEVFVVPPSHLWRFEDEVKRVSHEFSQDWSQIQIWEQCKQLSTFRITPDGDPVLDGDELSLVPAGHGMLIHLMPRVRQIWPQAKTLLIRNIDNVPHFDADLKKAAQDFLWTFEFIRDAVSKIRRALLEGVVQEAAKIARTLLAQPGGEDQSPLSDLEVLWKVQREIFHSHCEAMLESSDSDQLKVLQSLYERPVNLLGQVPNIFNDVGGTPVFVKTHRGREKVCLEVPHASTEDRTTYLANPKKATHFNPVFVACEAMDAIDHYVDENNPYWLIADKTYKGCSVHYHETVLYELLGNSHFANAAFIEIPRSLFRPHKTFLDAQNNTRSTLGLDD